MDAVDYPHVDHVSQIDSLPFIADDSVDLIYACHVLEHFKRSDTARVLAEWKRVLKPKGVLRLAVPDFGAACEVYQKYGRLDLVVGLIYGRQDYLYNIHYNVFDYASLSKLLVETGFTGGGGGEIRRYDWRETEHAAIDDYSQAYIPHMDKENGILVSLNVECVKP
ncbi:MAG: methyltransferase domain-containing protein [Helicobacteraceae bacterium]|nr:methyltransferase domain-containing protein [Helicobacteraceae bacterium]